VGRSRSRKISTELGLSLTERDYLAAGLFAVMPMLSAGDLDPVSV
jgi:hypothetical protein